MFRLFLALGSGGKQTTAADGALRRKDKTCVKQCADCKEDYVDRIRSKNKLLRHAAKNTKVSATR